MILESVYALNLYSFEELDLDFKPYLSGVTAILGKNLDMDDPNAAGKSNIFRILYVGIWGTDPLKSNLPFSKMVLSKKKNKGYMTDTKFLDPMTGDHYRILRWKSFKDKTDRVDCNGNVLKKSGLEFYVNGKLFHAKTESAKIVQEKIASRLGMTQNIFKHSVFIHQFQEEHFLETNDTKQKEILSELLDLSYFKKAFELVKVSLKNLRESIIKLESTVELYNKRINDNKQQILELTEKEKNFKKEINLEINDLENEIIELKQKSKSFEQKANHNYNDIKKLNEEKQILQKVVKDKKASYDKFILINEEINNIIKNINQLTLELNKYKNSVSNNNNIIKHSEDQIKELQNNLVELPNVEKDKKDFDMLTEKAKKLQHQLDETTKREQHLIKLINNNENNNEKIKELQDQLIYLEKNQECIHCDQKFKNQESLNKHKQKINTKIKDLLDNHLKDEIIKIENSLNEYNSDSIRKNILQIEKELTIKAENIKNFQKDQLKNNKINNSIESIKKKIISLTKSNIEDNNKYKKAFSLYKSEKDKLSKLKEEIKDLRNIKDSYEKDSKKLNDLLDSINEKQEDNNQINLAKKELENTNNKIKDILKNIDSTKKRNNPYSKLLAQENQKISKYIQDKDLKVKELEKLKKEKIKLDFAKKGFSPTGIPSFVIDDIIHILNEKTQEYLSFLSNNNIDIDFKINEETNKLDNSIEIDIHINGEQRDRLLNSGGELQRGKLSVNLAFSHISESRIRGNPFNFQFLDESMTHISQDGEMIALSLFKKLAEQKQGFFLITHNKDIQNFAQNHIFVVKQNNISRLVSKEEFESL